MKELFEVEKDWVMLDGRTQCSNINMFVQAPADKSLRVTNCRSGAWHLHSILQPSPRVVAKVGNHI